MEKEKKVAKKPTKKVEAVKEEKVVKAEPKKVVKTTPKATPAKAKKEVAKVEKVEAAPKAEAKVVEQAKAEKKPITLNQELNLLIGLFSLITIITFCFAFQGGDAEILGWELFLKAGQYSGVFKGLMIIYVVSIFVDCILAIRVDSENEIFNIVEKVLYMFTVIMNFIVVAVLLSIIKKVGIGLIIFFIISIISAITKFARIFAQNK